MSRIALLSSCFPDRLIPAAQALRAAGFELVCGSSSGTTLARAGIEVLPIEFFAKERALLGGRYACASSAVLGGIGGRRDVARELQELASQKVRVIDVVMIELPTAASALGLEEGDREGAAQCITRSGFIADAAALEAAVLNAGAVVPLTSADRAIAWIRLAGHGSIDEMALRVLAEEAWLHLQAFRDFVAWALALPTPDDVAGRSARSPAEPTTATRPTSAAPAPPAAVSNAGGKIAGRETRTEVGEEADDDDDDDDDFGFDAAAQTEMPEPATFPSSLSLPQALSATAPMRVAFDPRVGSAWRINGELPSIAATLGVLGEDDLLAIGTALGALQRLGIPGVAVARAGHLNGLVRLTSTPARALLRALSGDGLAMRAGTLVMTLPLDLTSARVLATQAPGLGVKTIAATAIGDDEAEILRQADLKLVLVAPAQARPTHQIGSDALGAWAAPIAPMASFEALLALLEDESIARSAHIGLAAITNGAATAAAVAGAEQLFVSVTGQSHVSDAVQIALGKARQFAAGAVLVVAGAFDAPELIKAAVGLKIAAVLHRPNGADEANIAAPSSTKAGGDGGLRIVALPKQ